MNKTFFKTFLLPKNVLKLLFYLLSKQHLCPILYLRVEQHFNHGRELVSPKEIASH